VAEERAKARAMAMARALARVTIVLSKRRDSFSRERIESLSLVRNLFSRDSNLQRDSSLEKEDLFSRG
jgi:hypothetical protein